MPRYPVRAGASYCRGMTPLRAILGGTLFLLAGLQYLLTETITAAAWSSPPAFELLAGTLALVLGVRMVVGRRRVGGR